MKQNSKNNKEIWKTAWHILNPSAATIKRNINESTNFLIILLRLSTKFLDTTNFIKLLPEKFTDKTVYAVTKKHWGSTKNNKKHI